MKLFSLFLIFSLTACSPIVPLNDPFEKQPPTQNDSALPSASHFLLKIIAIDVGQGDATLVIGPGGRTLLIDAGQRGMGLERVLPELSRRSVDRLDAIIATHYDADHIGGLAEVLKGQDQLLGTDDDIIPAIALFDRGDGTDKSTPSFLEYRQIAAPYRQEITPGSRIDLGQGAVARVIVVNGHYEDGRVIHLNPDEENESSIGLLIEYGSFRYFTAGDLTGGGAPGGSETKDMETIAGEILGDLDVVHLSHHGSLSSTNENFLEATTPEAAVISAGLDNDYGHPHPVILNRLEEHGIPVYRTDQMKMKTVEIITDGDHYTISPN